MASRRLWNAVSRPQAARRATALVRAGRPWGVEQFSLAGTLRRVRRIADCSQRQLADHLGVSKATVAAAETGARDLQVGLLVRAAERAGLQIALVDAAGELVAPMRGAPARDRAGRRFPAHLDTRYGDEGWWHGSERYSRRRPSWTFDRDRTLRDERRGWTGTPDEHLDDEPGDPLARRAGERRRAAEEQRAVRRAERWRRWVDAGAVSEPDWGTGCTCPPGCEYAEGVNEDLSHAAECVCRCDVG